MSGLSRVDKAVRSLRMQYDKAVELKACPDPKKVFKSVRGRYFSATVTDADFDFSNEVGEGFDERRAREEAEPKRLGWFKLQCSYDMDPRIALVVYRHRVAVERMISGIKNVANLIPLRVWNTGRTRGALMLSMLSQLVVSTLIRELEPAKVKKMVDGRPLEVPSRPSARTVAGSLGRWSGILKETAWGTFETEAVDRDDLSFKLEAAMKSLAKKGRAPTSGKVTFDPPADTERRPRKDIRTIEGALMDTPFGHLVRSPLDWKGMVDMSPHPPWSEDT